MVQQVAQPVRVLIVEDSENDARLIVRELARSGWEPVFQRVDTAAEMEAALDAGAWDVVVSDHALPAFDSLAALELLKQRNLDVPFIIVSGAMSEEAAVTAMKAGAHDYISKSASGRLVPAIERELREFANRRRAEDVSRRRQREAEALALIARETAEDPALPAVTQRIADRVLRLFDASVATVRLKDAEGRLAVVALAGLTWPVPPAVQAVAPGVGIVGRACAEGRVVWTTDLFEDPRVSLPADVREQYTALGIHAVLAAPLRAGDEVIGTLSVADTRVREFPEAEVAFFHALAAQAALAVRNSQLLASEQAARSEAESLNRAKDEFLAMLAHELRNPLSAISTAVGVLERIGKQDPVASRSRHVIRRQTQHLKRLVDDLLDVARVTTGKIVLSRQPLDLGDAVHACLAHMTEGGRLAQQRLDVHVDRVWVTGDPTRLEQITINLVDNALKHTPPGGVITVSVRREGRDAVLSVRDTGAGIASDLLPHVFDLFTQGRRGLDRQQGGLGIGLTLVRRLVEQHGGRVDASSAGPGQGSEFVVRLPAVEPEQAAVAPVTRGSGSTSRRVVVVEDNADARTMLRLLLEMSGHQVEEAADGLSGLDVALRVQPDVALVDIGLPGIDGYELARRLRERAPDIRLVAVTGYGQPEDRDRAFEAGFTTHLVKPVGPDDLDRVLDQ
jgi:signal transduction histidine kinase